MSPHAKIRILEQVEATGKWRGDVLFLVLSVIILLFSFSLVNCDALFSTPHVDIFLDWIGTPYRDVAHAWTPPDAGFV